MKHDTLVVITTFNNSSYTKACLESLKDQSCDVIIYDDCSWDDTEPVCRKFHMEFVKRRFPRGLTTSCNMAYRTWLSRNYRFLIIANNDILVPDGSIAKLCESLEHHPYVGSLTRRADKSVFEVQSVEDYYPLSSEAVNDPGNAQGVQDFIGNQPTMSRAVDHVYGFFAGFSRKIVDYEYAPGYLYNPVCVNTGQEYDLGRRTRGGHVCLNSFVFHHKGISTGVREVSSEGFKETRNQLTRYHGGTFVRNVKATIGTGLNALAVVDAGFKQKLASKKMPEGKAT